MAEFSEQSITVIGASVDILDNAQRTGSRHQLTFPLAYGLDAKKISLLTGASYDEENGYLHATGFILDPEGTVAVAVYSTGAIGRLLAKDSLGWISYLSKKK